MTVGELIERLQKYNKTTRVMLDVDDNWNNHSSEIEDVYEDYLIDINGHSHGDRCVYINTDLKNKIKGVHYGISKTNPRRKSREVI